MRDVVVSLGCLAWKVYSLPQQWTAGDESLCHMLGVVSRRALDIEWVVHLNAQLMIGLHVWSSLESYGVLGFFGR